MKKTAQPCVDFSILGAENSLMTTAMSETPYSTLIVETVDNIRVIRLNRPERMNAVVKPLYDDLLKALHEAEKDDQIKAVLLTGNGRAFCAGADLKAHKEGRTPEEKAVYLAAEQDVCRKIFTLSKPVVAAVNGYAIGAGFEMALNCDFIVMADTAQMSLPEVDLGTFVGGGVSWLLPRMVGLPAARKLLFGEIHSRDDLPANRLTAAMAEEFGLVTRIIPIDNFLNGAMEFTRKLANKPIHSVQKMKAIIREGFEQTYEQALEAELNEMIECSSSEDWQKTVSKQ